MVLDSIKWDSGRWDGWGIILGWIPSFFRDIWSNKTSETLVVFVIFSILCLLFSQYCLTSKSPLPFEKSIPGLPRLEPHRKVNATTLYKFPQTFKTLRKTANLFSNLDFLPKSGFPKTLDFPMIVQGFLMGTTPWEPMGARPARRPDQRADPTSYYNNYNKITLSNKNILISNPPG